jgi:predicted TIM-barrel fold metal-dependent hydrolase
VPPSDANEAFTRRHMEEHTITYEAMAGIMDAAGVTGALLVSPGGLYGNDNRYALDAAEALPDRFAVVARLDQAASDIGPQLRDFRDTPGCVGVRVLVFTEEQRRGWETGALDPLFAAAADLGLPVCLYPPGLLGELPALLRRFPGLKLVVDHLGVRQPPLLPPGVDGLAELPALLALADLPNLSVKVTGFHALSAGPAPFADLTEPLHRVVAAFGADRLMWGSDWTRSDSALGYRDTVSYVLADSRLSTTDRALLLGGTLRRVFGWR